MAPTCWFALVGTLTLSFNTCFFQISNLNFFYQTLSYFEYVFCSMSNKQDGHQNSRRLSVCFCIHSNLVIYPNIFLISYMSYFHQNISQDRLLVLSDDVTMMATKMATTYHFALVDTLTWSFMTRFLPNFIYGLHSSNFLLCPQRNFGRHIVIALSVRQSVRVSVPLRVRCISPIFFEVGIPNLVCGCILG